LGKVEGRKGRGDVGQDKEVGRGEGRRGRRRGRKDDWVGGRRRRRSEERRTGVIDQGLGGFDKGSDVRVTDAK
jgi:hypothetical protein